MRINHILNDYINITPGELQGTVLSRLPLLIDLYNIKNFNTTDEIISYVDDTTVLFTGTDWDDVSNKIDIRLRDMKKWLDWVGLVMKKRLDNNLLSINIIKSKFICFYFFKFCYI